MPSTPEPTRSREERLAEVYRRAGEHRRHRNRRLAAAGTAAAVVLLAAVAATLVAADDGTTVVADRSPMTSSTTTTAAPADDPPTTAPADDRTADDDPPPPPATSSTDPGSPTTTAPAPVDHGQALRDRTYRSVSVTDDGQPWALGDGTEIRVQFEGRSDGDVVRWWSGCNTVGAAVVITADQLLVGEGSGTAIGCDEDNTERDRWTGRFFDADPSWALDGTRLRLESGSSVIELDEVPAGEG